MCDSVGDGDLQEMQEIFGSTIFLVDGVKRIKEEEA